MSGPVNGLGIALSMSLLVWTGLLFVPFRWRPFGLYLIVPKLYAGACAPLIAVMGLLLAGIGLWGRSRWMIGTALLVTVGAVIAILRVLLLGPDLATALGRDWARLIPPERRAMMLGSSWRGRLRSRPEPRVRQDVPFAMVPGTDRTLLCDVWQPPSGVPASGLAMVYLHGSAYSFLDKDVGTRPLFRHLAAQGHVIVDVAYRLFPETDIPGMVADARRAVAWVQAHATELEARPDCIVLCGASAGGHLALLAAYAHEVPLMTPPELTVAEPRVCAVVSLYGTVDLTAVYDHTGQREHCRPDDPEPDWNAAPPRWAQRMFGDDASRLGLQRMMVAGRCDWLLGGTPSEVPERYEQVAASRHVRPGCPPTLLVHGLHDEMAPVAPVKALQQRLEDVGVPVTAVYVPHTDHAFDLVGTAWSLPARTLIHALEEFLASISVSR